MTGKIGIVIVTFNSADVIEACLDSCGDLPAVVVDNASQDATLAQIHARPQLSIIANTANLGFAAAANQGVNRLDSEFILLLNPDVQLRTPLDRLLEAFNDPDTAIASGTLVDTNGKMQRGFTVRRFPSPITLALEALGINALFPSNPVNRRYRCLDLDLTKPQEVEQPAGAFLMFRRKVWAKLGGFDIRFHPLWFEDVDFCRRTANLGLRIRCIPQVQASHIGGNSISKLTWGCREVYWYASLLRYASKHFNSWAFRGVSLAVVLGSVFRAAFRAAKRRSSEPFSVYARVIRLAILCAVRGRKAVA